MSRTKAAFRAYAELVVPALESAGLSQGQLIAFGGWQPAEGEDNFILRPASDVAVHSVLMGYRDVPEHAACIAAVKADPSLASRTDVLVGTVMGRSTVQASTLPEHLVLDMFEAGDGFDESFDRLHGWLTRSEETYVVIAPLSGVVAETTPIILDASVRIDRMTDEEVGACLNTGLIPPLNTEFVHVDKRVALRIEERWPLVVSGVDNSKDEARKAFENRAETIERAVHMFRLYKGGTTSVPGTVTFPRRQFGSRSYTYGHSPSPRHSAFESYRLDTAAVDSLPQLWADLQAPQVANAKFLKTAIRRFAYAGERPRPDDQILDLIIAGEALFTPSAQAETGHKLALRAALFVGDLAASRHEMFVLMKRAYGARSKIAHGETVGTLKMPDGTDATMAEYVDLVAPILREGLKRMIARALQGTALESDEKWDRFTTDHITLGNA